MAGRLGDILVDRGDITEAQLQSALKAQGSERGMLGAILVRRGLIVWQQLGSALATQFEVPFFPIVPHTIHPQVVRLLPEEFARSRLATPVEIENGTLTLAMASPDDIEAIAETELLTGYRVRPVVSLEHEMQSALDQAFDERIVARQTIVDMKMADLKDVGELAVAESIQTETEQDSAPVVRLVRSILIGAIEVGASDIHLEPHVPEMRVRYRVDGELQQVMTIPEHIEEALVARIKVLAEMDTTETRRPQDGHLALVEAGAKANFRVSTIPTVGGEKVVMRLLDEGRKVFDLDQMGFGERELQLIRSLSDKPYGMVVVTGPTGSGKTTTMYAMLSRINTVQRNIVTVEDPVEYRLPGINQVSADNDHGLGFNNALKYILRQDPDVILLGEIRDHETSATAVQAALTGHLLISTLHTNDAVGAVARLKDLGVDAFKIGGALLGSIAQRLLRAICPDCKEPCEPNERMLETLLKGRPVPDDATFFHGRGCRRCLGSGYSGRIPIFEILVVTPAVSDAIERGLPPTNLREIAIEEGMTTLVESGLTQVYAGRTTLEEVFYKVSS